jgi:hypothetical protein
MESTTKKKRYFVGQRSDETVLFMSRRHYFPMFLMFGRNLFFAVIWSLIVSGAIISYAYLRGYSISSQLITFVVCISLLMLLATFSTTWTIYYLSLTVITDNRLVKIVQKGVFMNYTREVKLTALQDTSFTFANWIQSMFNYGTLVAHTASGEEGKFQVRFLPNPRAVHHYLNKLNKIIHDSELDHTKPSLPPFQAKEMWKE